MKSKSNFFFLFSFLALASCGTEDNKSDKQAKIEVTTENTFNSSEFDFVLPQPISLAKAFQASGLSYNKSFANPSANMKNYSSKVKQLLNLGVYSTDLAYSAINGQEQEARSYLKAVQELGNMVGLKPVFSDKSMIEKFDKNLNNMEAIEDLIYDIQEKSEEFMDDNDIRYLAVVQFAGSWTEGMYIGIMDNETKKSENLSVTIIDQINLLKNIIKGIKTYPTSDETLSSVIKQLSNILSTYENFDSVKTANQSSTFVFPKLTEADLSSLGAKVKELRNFVVK